MFVRPNDRSPGFPRGFDGREWSWRSCFSTEHPNPTRSEWYLTQLYIALASVSTYYR